MNYNYFVYQIDNGQVVQSGICEPEFFNSFSAERLKICRGIASISSSYIQDGKVVDMPPKPGEFYSFDYGTKQWVPDAAMADAYARGQRNQLLAQSDWTQLPDVPLETKQAWAAYRQELRDITGQPGYPFNIVWPTPPQ